MRISYACLSFLALRPYVREKHSIAVSQTSRDRDNLVDEQASNAALSTPHFSVYQQRARGKHLADCHERSLVW
jgi:hypothetical protein